MPIPPSEDGLYRLRTINQFVDSLTELPEASADGLYGAFQDMLRLRYIEERWDAVVEEFADFEVAALRTAANNILFHPTSIATHHGVIATLNRRLLSLLAACRLYLDSTSRKLRKLTPDDDDLYDSFKASRASAYDSSFSYRFCEALRNYATHDSVPIHGTRIKNVRVNVEQRMILRHNASPFVRVSELVEDKKFKPALVVELKAKDNEVEFLPVLREYIELLSGIHTDLRAEFRYLQEHSIGTLKALVEFHIDPAERRDGDVFLWLERRLGDGFEVILQVNQTTLGIMETLQRKNRRLENLTKRYVIS